MPVSTVATGGLDLHTKLQTYIAAQWVVGATPRTAIEWPNVTDIIWTDGSKNPFPPPNGYWMRVNIKSGIGKVMTHGTLGDNLVKGVVILQLFGPKGEGNGGLLALAGYAKTMMNRKDIEDIVTLAAWNDDPQDDVREGQLRCNVTTEFYYYERAS